LVKNGILDELFTGVTIKHFSQQKLRKVEFVVPSLNEQERIVEILEEQLSRLDAALTSVRAVREKSARFRRSLLHRTMSRPDKSLEDNEFNDWCTTNLGAVVSFLNGYAFKSEWYVEEGIRVVRGQNISHGYLDWSETRMIDKAKSVEFSRFNLIEGDILVSLDRPIISTGFKWAVVKKSDLPALLLQRVAVLRADDDVLDSNFLMLWAQSPYLVEKINPGRSNGIPHISTVELSALEISFPSLEKQRQLVIDIEEQISRLDASLAVTDVIEKKAFALRRSLLHRAFTGELTKEWREGTHV
jgi:restriction endonuclease S subunit